LQFGQQVFQVRGELVNVTCWLLQTVLQVGEYSAHLIGELIEAPGHVLLQRREALIYNGKNPGGGRFWFPLWIGQMEIDLALFRDRDELLFRDIFPARVGGIPQLRCVNPILRKPFEKCFGVGPQQPYALRKDIPAAHFPLSFILGC
jgi:hypothetical protein